MSALRFIPAGIAGALFLFAGGLLPLAPASAQTETQPTTNNEQRAANNVFFDIPAQNLGEALSEFARQSGQELIYAPEAAQDRSGNAVIGEMTRGAAMEQLLVGTGLEFLVTPDGGMMIGEPATVDAYRSRIRRRSGESAAALAGQNTVGQRRPGIEEIIVTGQKREERIQDVPIAISAFTQEDLKTSQIAGGPDLHLQVPNMTFTKTNFTGYSIQIRGIGTQAISATTDPAVAVALNQTPFIRNNFFEQEFYDLERVEVLRGPQGTLFGRNATAGVVNLITAKPSFQEEAMLSLDKGNYDSRRWEFMVNEPLVGESVALRISGAGTKRDGYATNEITESPIDGRDLWSTRVSLRFAPTDGPLDINFMWEHFEENDDRIRSGKQLCKQDVYPEETFADGSGGGGGRGGVQATLSQGCERNSLYAADSFQVPMGATLPYYVPLGGVGLPVPSLSGVLYADQTQSRDLRVIESTVDPEYRAKSDIGQILIDYELTDTLLLESETAYSVNEIFSKQDFNRFNTAPGAWRQPSTVEDFSSNPTGVDRDNLLLEGPDGGIFCDPQLGCSDRLVVVDVSSAESTQFSQEFRLSSQFGGPINFSLGANFLRYDTEDKYYVFSNSFSLFSAAASGFLPGNYAGSSRDLVSPYVVGETTNEEYMFNGLLPGDPDGIYSISEWTYMDPNPIGSLNDLGHNYFLSKNPYKLISYGIFGETYWDITDTLKLTAGLRWSVDRKEAPRIPSQLLASSSVGYPVAEVIEQTWREPTGRLVLDWKPMLGFTDETLLYGSYARGYKAGGANPPSFARVYYSDPVVATDNLSTSLTRPKTFDAEFVNAFEIGTKNTLADGALTLNMAAFYYDYSGYQVSEIVDRSAFNRNFDLDVWGAEIETDWWLTENFKLGFKGGYQKTRIDDGEKAVDLMDRTAGDPDWLLVRPFPTFASSCILPRYVYYNENDELYNIGNIGGGGASGCELAYSSNLDPVTHLPYVPNPTDAEGNIAEQDIAERPNYPGFDPSTAPNNGEGIAKELGGNELPNAPNYTATITGDYIIPLTGDWLATLHTDLYWQSESWWRVFNDHEYNRLDDYFTMNLAVIFKNEVSGWDIMTYIKNVTDETAITGAFLNSDDTGLTTNTFLTEPRLFGIRVTKHWSGGDGGPNRWLSNATALLGKEPGEPSPWELTLGGYMLRPGEAPAQTYMPTFITEFDPQIDPTGKQSGDLDWGDGREIVLTYAQDNGWRFSLGARFGESVRDRTNSDRIILEGETFRTCALEAPCLEDDRSGGQRVHTRTNYGLTELNETEEHLLVDFTVGRDVGLGGFLQGELSAGLRYAQFKSSTDVVVRGTPDWVLPEENFALIEFPGLPKYAEEAQRTEYNSGMKTDREFEGAGPIVAWDSSTRLFGGEGSGRLDVDWSLSGGVLFGRQKTSVEGFEEGAYYSQDHRQQRGNAIQCLPNCVDLDPHPIRFVPSVDPLTPVSSYSTSFGDERSTEAAVVSTLGATLGLTYRMEGASIGLGYSWERYFNAIDGGIEERKEYDRTIDGPYLKVTFGGGS